MGLYFSELGLAGGGGISVRRVGFWLSGLEIYLKHYVTMKKLAYSATALFVSVGSASASLWVDFNSTTQDGGPHNDPAYQAYNAGHEVATDFVTQNFATTFAITGAANVGVTPTWPLTTDNRVQQMIDRGAGNDAQYTTPGPYSLDLVTDWIGIDTRTGNGGNGNFDGTTGNATHLTLTLSNLPAGSYNWLSIHHDTENVFTNFNVYLDGALVGTGYQSDSSTGGNPDSGANRTDGPASTFSTSFTSDGSDVAITFEPLSGELGNAVHNQLFAVNGFQLTQVPEPSTGLLGLLGAGFLLRRRR